VLVLDILILAVLVNVTIPVRVVKRLVETVAVADIVFVGALVLDPQGLCVFVLELLVEDVCVAEDVDVLVVEGEVVAPEKVAVGDEENEPGGDIVGGGARVIEPVPVWVTVGRPVAVTQDVAVAERVCTVVAEPEGVAVWLNEPFCVSVTVRVIGDVGLSARHLVGVADVDCVLDCAELLVTLDVALRERDTRGDRVPVLEDVIVRVAVPDAVWVLEVGPLLVPVEEIEDVFD